MSFIIAQILGGIGAVFASVASQMKDKKKYLIFYALSYAVFIASFILLEAYPGAVNCFILMILTLITSRYNDNKKIPRLLIFFFLILIFVGIYITYTDLYSLLPAIASIFYLLILMTSDMKKVRNYTLILRALWVIYDVVVKAYIALAFDIFSITSNIIAMIRYDRNKPINK